MAKRDFRWLTAPITMYVAGLADQELLHQSGVGHLGKLNPTQTQAAFGGVATVAGGLTRLLSRRETAGTRIMDGILGSGLFALGQSTTHQVDRWMTQKSTASNSPSSSTTPSGSNGSSNADASADASITSSSADSTQDTQDSVNSATDGSETFAY